MRSNSSDRSWISRFSLCPMAARQRGSYSILAPRSECASCDNDQSDDPVSEAGHVCTNVVGVNVLDIVVCSGISVCFGHVVVFVLAVSTVSNAGRGHLSKYNKPKRHLGTISSYGVSLRGVCTLLSTSHATMRFRAPITDRLRAARLHCRRVHKLTGRVITDVGRHT